MSALWAALDRHGKDGRELLLLPPKGQSVSINNGIRAAGVVWHECQGCGREWPFPTGVTMGREWHCAICVNALWSKLQRLSLRGAEQETPSHD